MSRAEHPNSTPLENLATGAAGWNIPLFPAIIARRSLYALTDTPNGKVPESRIKEIVSLILTHAPSPFNVQSARCVILLGDNHKKMWEEADRLAKGSLPAHVYEGFLKPRILGFIAAVGSVSEMSLTTLSLMKHSFVFDVMLLKYLVTTANSLRGYIGAILRRRIRPHRHEGKEPDGRTDDAGVVGTF